MHFYVNTDIKIVTYPIAICTLEARSAYNAIVDLRLIKNSIVLKKGFLCSERPVLKRFIQIDGM